MKRLLKALAVLASMAGPAQVLAEELKIGSFADPAVDPHYLFLSPNIAYSRHIFDGLVDKDDNSQWRPGLAESWRAVDDLTWEFKLRKGVKFHDGSDFTAKDVAFSVDRVPSIPNNPAPYTSNLRGVTNVEVVDDHTIRVRTKAPNPTLPGTIGQIFIVSHKAAQGATPEDFRSGKAAIGTGPYKFVRYLPSERLELVRNEAYWGTKPHYDKVTFRVIPNGTARVAALMAGDVDVIDAVPPSDVPTLKASAKASVFMRPSDRVIYLIPDIGRAVSPFITDANGAPLGKNPLQDLRVRKALSLGVNRDALVSQVMEGLAVPASQAVPQEYVGYNNRIKPDSYDPNAAKKLLAEAGYPDGFGITLHGPNDRYVNDAKVLQAVAQMWSRIGLKTKVETMPRAIYFGRVRAPTNEFSMALLGWGSSDDGEATFTTSSLFHTYDKDLSVGYTNHGLYSSAVADAAIKDATSTMDREQRRAKLEKVMEIVSNDMAIIPLHHQMTVIATRKGIAYAPRDDENTLAMNARPAQM